MKGYWNSKKEMAPQKTKQALGLATEKGSSAWFTVLPIQDLGFNLNKRDFCDPDKLRYNWPIIKQVGNS